MCVYTCAYIFLYIHMYISIYIHYYPRGLVNNPLSEAPRRVAGDALDHGHEVPKGAAGEGDQVLHVSWVPQKGFKANLW